MNLHDKLKDILPKLLPRRPEDAVKGTELISRVRGALGESYSDGTLRTQFSLLALEEDTCLARIPGGQGYYLRRDGDPLPGLQDVMTGRDSQAETPLHRAIALAVRLYDTAGSSVFAYPVTEESWCHPDLVAVQWPAGRWMEDGTYRMENRPGRRASYRAVCVSLNDDEEGLRRDFFRALSGGEWAQEMELLLVGSSATAARYAAALGSAYGVGVRLIGANNSTSRLPHADELLRMEASQTQELISQLTQCTYCSPIHRADPLISARNMPDVLPMLHWAEQCVERGSGEAYERRVAIY